MTRGNILAIIFIAILLAAAVAIKIKYSGRVIVTNETSETVFRDGKQLERDLLRGSPTKEDWARIEERYDYLLEKYPDAKEVPYARLKLAQLYSRGYGEHQRAVEALHSIIKDYPADNNITRAANDELLNIASRIAKSGGDKQQAIDIYQEYLHLFPNSRKAPYLILNVGIIQESMGNPAEAEARYRELMADFPDSNYTLRATLRLAFLGLANDGDAEARKLLMTIVKEHPGTDEAAVAQKKLDEIGAVNVFALMDQYYLKYYGTKRPFGYRPAKPLNSWDALSAIAAEKLDARKYDIVTSIEPEASTIELKGTVTLVNDGDEKSLVTLQLNEKMGKLILTSKDQPLDFRRNGNLVEITLPDPLAKGDTLELGFEATGAVGTNPECNIAESGYALPQFAWYPMTLPGDEFTCSLEFHNPKDVTLRTIGEKDLAQPLGITKWEVKDPVTGVFFFYGRHHQDDKMSDGIEASYIKPALSDTRTKEIFEAISSIYGFYHTALGKLPTKKIVIIETVLPGDFIFIDAPGVILFDEEQVSDGILVNLLSYAIAHQYFGIRVPETPSPEWTPFLSEGLQSFLEIFYMKESKGKDAMLQRFDEIREIYMAIVSSAGDQPLMAPGEDTRIYTALLHVKSPLVIEMLRQALGSDLKFVKALGRYLADSENGINTLQGFTGAFNAASGTNWDQFIDAWVRKSGLPLYKLAVPEINESGGKFETSIEITQTGNPVAMPIDVLFNFAGKDPKTETADILYTSADGENGTGGFTQDFSFEFSDKPVEIILDPENRIVKDPASTAVWKEKQE